MVTTKTRYFIAVACILLVSGLFILSMRSHLGHKSPQSSKRATLVAQMAKPDSPGNQHALYRDLLFEHPGTEMFQGTPAETKRLVDRHHKLTASPESAHKAKGYHFLAMQALREGNHELALQHFDMIYGDPESPSKFRFDAGLQRLKLLAKLDRGPELASALDAMQRDFLDKHEHHRRQALSKVALELGFPEVAFNLLAAIVTQETAKGQQAALQAAKSFRTAGDLDRAESIIRLALGEGESGLHKPLGPLYAELAKVLFLAGKSSQAEQLVYGAIERLGSNENYPDFPLEIVDVFKGFDVQQWETRLLALADSEIVGLRVGAMERLADMAIHRRDWTSASELLVELMQHEGRTLERQQGDYLRLLRSYGEAGDGDRFQLLLTDALNQMGEEAGGNRRLFIGLADTLSALKRTSEAKEVYEGLAQLGYRGTGTAESHYKLANILRKEGNEQEAAVIFRDLALQKEKEKNWSVAAMGWAGLARSLENLESMQELLPSVEQSMEKAIRKVPALERMSWADYLRNGAGLPDLSSRVLELERQDLQEQHNRMDMQTRLERTEGLATTLSRLANIETSQQVAFDELARIKMDPAFMSPELFDTYLRLQSTISRNYLWQRDSDAESSKQQASKTLGAMADRNRFSPRALSSLAMTQAGTGPDGGIAYARLAVSLADPDDRFVHNSKISMSMYELKHGRPAVAAELASQVLASRTTGLTHPTSRLNSRTALYMLGLAKVRQGGAEGRFLMDVARSEGRVWTKAVWLDEGRPF